MSTSAHQFAIVSCLALATLVGCHADHNTPGPVDARSFAEAATREGNWRAAATRWHEVYLAEGPSYFNGAGPRLVDGLEILAEILHREAFPGRRRSGYTRVGSAARTLRS